MNRFFFFSLLLAFVGGCNDLQVESEVVGEYAAAEDIKTELTTVAPSGVTVMLLDTSGSHKLHSELKKAVNDTFLNKGISQDFLVVPIMAGSGASANSVWQGKSFGHTCPVPNLIDISNRELCADTFGANKCYGKGDNTQEARQIALLGEGGTVDDPKPGSGLATCMQEVAAAQQKSYDEQAALLQGYLEALKVARYTDIQGAINVALEQTEGDITVIILSDMVEDLRQEREGDLIESFGDDRKVRIEVLQVVQEEEPGTELEDVWTTWFTSKGATSVNWSTFRLVEGVEPETKAGARITAKKQGAKKAPKIIKM